jgi:multiple sugar transport system permease protein
MSRVAWCRVALQEANEVGLALFQAGFAVGRPSAASSSVTLFVFLRRQFVQGVASTGRKE